MKQETGMRQGHTPGPWSIEPNEAERDRLYIIGENGSIVASVLLGLTGVTGDKRKRRAGAPMDPDDLLDIVRAAIQAATEGEEEEP